MVIEELRCGEVLEEVAASLDGGQSGSSAVKLGGGIQIQRLGSEVVNGGVT
jgi:hypothetical protein